MARNSEETAKMRAFLPQFVVGRAFSAVYWMDVLDISHAFITA
jgi:hypothetical protein